MKQTILKHAAVWLSVLMVVSTMLHTNRAMMATVSALDDIRVALFIEQTSTVPVATITSSQPLELSNRLPSGLQPLVSGEKTVRVSLDQYRLIVGPFSSYDEARHIYEQVETNGYSAFIIEQHVGSSKQYEVILGSFSTEDDAQQILEELQRKASFSNLNMELGGPHYLSLGTNQSVEESVEQVETLAKSGIRAYVVVVLNGQEEAVYTVWIGGTADDTSLKQLESNVKKVLSNVTLNTVDTDIPYMVLSKDVTEGSESVVSHYAMQANDMKLWISSSDSLQLRERYSRAYRGAFEISQYNGSMAVINELPFEAYLYSVVGSEMGADWPSEALKAQAVAARTYALKQGMKYGIAHISDTTYDQTYKGIAVESPSVIAAVTSTEDEVMVDENGLINAIYSSNAGGLTADPSEVWGNVFDYLQSIPSPDHGVEETVLAWDHVMLEDGTVGYVRTDFTMETGEKNAAGLDILVCTEMVVNVRRAPYVDNVNNAPITQINEGDRMIRFDQDLESNAYRWIYGPYSGDQLLSSINQSSLSTIRGPLLDLEVTQRGPSGRVTEVKANGDIVHVDYADQYRSAFLSLPSTRFDIEQMNRYAVLSGEELQERELSTDGLYVLSADASTPQYVNHERYFAMNEPGEARMLTSETMYRFVGLGYGHGLGMSQWGAHEMASYMGYDYEQILTYYFKDIDIVKSQ